MKLPKRAGLAAMVLALAQSAGSAHAQSTAPTGSPNSSAATPATTARDGETKAKSGGEKARAPRPPRLEGAATGQRATSSSATASAATVAASNRGAVNATGGDNGGRSARTTAGSSAGASGKGGAAKATSSNSTVKSSKSTRSGNKTGSSSNGQGSSTQQRKASREGAKGDTTASDPELALLEQAEKALFPWALRGIRAGYAFDDPFAHSSVGAEANTSPATAWTKELTLPSIFPNVDGRILTYLEFYRATSEGKAILRTWARKRGRYESAITSILAKVGVPKELVWQSMVESGHNPTIRSPAGAAGLWQFMPDTARAYGLVVDRWMDERLDPESSTAAAARMMADLFQRFGNWELALAAYNMGDAGLMRSIRKYNTNDFWALSRYEAGIPRETALYVPRVVALTIAMQNPSAFGIADITPDDPVEFDTVSLAPGQLLAPVARVIGVTDDELCRYNPQLLAQRVPPSNGPEKIRGRIFVPRGKAELAGSRVGRLLGLEPDLTAYAVKNGETLDWIANARSVSVETLRSINRVTTDERIEPGTIILVPRQANEPTESKASDEDRVAVVPPNSDAPAGQRRVFYRTKSGDNLSSIADAFGVSRADLLSYNSIDTSARLQPRMLLQLYVQKSARLEGLSYLDEKDVTVLVAGSPEFIEYFEGLRGNERIVVQAKQKDSLASIGSKYGVSVGMMERINRRSRRDELLPGESIVVYARRNGGNERLSAAR